ncbi:MAG TPA: response regulator [Tepidisphaeraceae bacterium]|nr:response regulator [Tepidisphaeraceae bacterium]
MSTILIVEDDQDTREIMGRYLTLGGYEHVSASNGWEALLAVDQNVIDLILLDVMMPGMDGVTFLNILRNAQTKRNTPVVIVTAMSKQELSNRFRDLPVQAVLPKTQELFDELMQTVHKILPDSPDGQGRHESEESKYTARDRF